MKDIDIINSNVIDICTGTGCIAISLAKFTSAIFSPKAGLNTSPIRWINLFKFFDYLHFNQTKLLI